MLYEVVGDSQSRPYKLPRQVPPPCELRVKVNLFVKVGDSQNRPG